MSGDIGNLESQGPLSHWHLYVVGDGIGRFLDQWH